MLQSPLHVDLPIAPLNTIKCCALHAALLPPLRR